MSENDNQPDFHAFAVSKNGEKTHYTRIGAVWANAKGGYGIGLNALPVNSEIVLFLPREDGDSHQPS